MTKITLTNNNNEIKMIRETFDAVVAWFSEGAKSVRINNETMTAEIRHEVRGKFGWEIATVIVNRM